MPIEFSSAPARDDAARAVRDAFTATYGYEPDGVWSAPGRVNIIGEHVDYQAGLCLPMAISHRCYVAAARTPGNTLRAHSAQEESAVELDARTLEPGSVPGWGGYAAGVLWALRKHIGGAQPLGMDLYLDGHVPFGSGLSSSASVECSVATAIDDLLTLGLDAAALVEASIAAESRFVGAPTGGLDQSASIRCKEGEALLLDCRDFSTQPITWDLASVGLEMLIVDTRASHSLGEGGGYAERRAQSEEAARTLGVATLRDVDPADLEARLETITDPVVAKRARHIVTEIQRVRDLVAVLEDDGLARRLDDVAALLYASHDSLRDDYEVTVPELDVAVDALRAAGAHGARMTGGGFGGSVISLIEKDQVSDAAEAVAAAFAAKGFAAPGFILALPSAGAGQDL